MKLKVLENIDVISGQLANLIMSRIEVFNEQNKIYFIALSGGDTPQNFYKMLDDLLSASSTDFSDSFGVIQLDERWVSRSNPRSNQAMIESKLPYVTKLANYHPIPTRDSYPTLDDAVADYETTVKQVISHHDSINLGIFGMGIDGHTASLFPEDPMLEKLTNNFVVSGYVESQKEQRITLTPAVFQHIRQKVFIITGSEKGSILRDALNTKKPKVFPVLMAIDNQSLVFLDQEAYDAYNV